MCLVFEALGSSLYDYVRMNNFKPLPLKCVQSFSQQLLISLRFLHKQRLVHTDLKPENILLTRCSFHDSWAVTKERASHRVCEPDKLDIKCKKSCVATVMGVSGCEGSESVTGAKAAERGRCDSIVGCGSACSTCC